nr:MAG TPA: hypothetical protein [Caudoviricetes sp.]
MADTFFRATKTSALTWSNQRSSINQPKWLS